MKKLETATKADKTRPLSIIPASVVYLLDRTPLLSNLPATIKQEVGNDILAKLKASDLRTDMEHDRAGFRYGIIMALRKMPVFSVYSTEAAENMVTNILDVCFDDAIQRGFKIDNLTDVEA